MKAVILAAGLGRRLRPVTDVLPKPLLPIAGKPVLAILLEGLARIEVGEVRLVVGHLGHLVRRFAGDGSRFGVRVSYAEQHERRGTAHALRQASTFIDDDLMVIGGDTALGAEPLRQLREFHERSAADASVCLKRVPREHMLRTSCVAVDPDGRVRDFVEKPASGEATGQLAAAMFHIYGPLLPEYLAGVEESPRGELELSSAVRAMIADGRRVMGLELERPPDLTDARDLLRLNFDYAQELLAGAPPAER